MSIKLSTQAFWKKVESLLVAWRSNSGVVVKFINNYFLKKKKNNKVKSINENLLM